MARLENCCSQDGLRRRKMGINLNVKKNLRTQMHTTFYLEETKIMTIINKLEGISQRNTDLSSEVIKAKRKKNL